MSWSNVRGMATALECATTVAAPPAAVWAVLADFAAMPRWMPGVARVAVTSQRQQGPNVARTVYYTSGRQTDEEVLTWYPDEGYAFTVLKGMPFWTHRATFTLESETTGRTTVKWSVMFEAAIPERQLTPLVTRLEATMTEGLANLKRLVESDLFPPAPLP